MSKSALKILDTAEKLFNENSFVGVGVDLIRDESGCSKTTMYTYYKNKNQLVKSVLIARDERFKQSLLGYVGDATGLEAINKILDWHTNWFRQDFFKGCLFVRAVAESNQDDQDIISISKAHKQWIKELIAANCNMPNGEALSELIYTVIEGLISRFLVDGFDETLAINMKNSINQLFNIHKNL
ncbi:TetR/AcrR family transcriptional regulator [Acinetobacter baumannii]|uniref:TetR/AcrR family transcriptional regulator n=1 Tax=Acinetobacter baumannii TaxID=470 RepID=UPI00234073EA|nr:TetR/AcrR family transcriptional regulator [Acinetobacter baumannii]